jgi:aryl-alcohol dehydrogenase-like predicted oxidoreductase
MEHRLLGRTGVSVSKLCLGTMMSQLSAAEVRLSDDVLDRIDAIVAPGVTINPADIDWVSPALDATARRR